MVKGMMQKAMMRWADNLLMKRGPRAVATRFSGLTTFIIVVGYLRGYEIQHVGLMLLAAGLASLFAVGLRWVEAQCAEQPRDGYLDAWH